MRKTLIAAALFSVFAGAQAQTVDVGGFSTDTGIIRVAASTVETGPFGPHHANLPGIGFDTTTFIDLQGISTSTYNVGTLAGFDYFRLPGYSHSDPAGGVITTNLNWVRVPTAGNDVYFGLATNPGTTTNQNAAFYVGDRVGAAVPTSATSYTVGGLLALPATSASAPIELAGTLGLVVSGATGSLSGTLSNSSGQSLAINPGAANNVNTSAGTFNGLASYNGGITTGSSVNGQFFGSGVGAGNSAIAGTASGGSGSGAYVAAFGGKN